MAIDQERAFINKFVSKGVVRHEIGQFFIGELFAEECLPLLLRAYATEERRAERERCLAIVRRHVKAGKVDRVDWLYEQIAGKIELGEG